VTGDAPSLAAQVAARKLAPSRLPQGVSAAYATEREQARAAGLPPGMLGPGDAMPDADLIDVHGSNTPLSTVIAGKRAVIVFYRGAWCPWCNLTLRFYEQHLRGDLDELGVPLIAISPQTPDSSLTMQEKNQLSFTVLSDPGNRLAAEIGILNPKRSAEIQAAVAGFGPDLASANADHTEQLSIPTTIIVGRSGRIRWIDVHLDYTMRAEPTTIVAAVKAGCPALVG
jgi:peroxiredoxin